MKLSKLIKSTFAFSIFAYSSLTMAMNATVCPTVDDIHANAIKLDHFYSDSDVSGPVDAADVGTGDVFAGTPFTSRDKPWYMSVRNGDLNASAHDNIQNARGKAQTVSRLEAVITLDTADEYELVCLYAAESESIFSANVYAVYRPHANARQTGLGSRKVLKKLFQ